MISFNTSMEASQILEAMVKKSVIGQTGNPDWSSILKLLEHSSKNTRDIPVILSIICKRLKKGPSGMKYNCLMLIDAMFKNLQGHALNAMQDPSLLRRLSSDTVSENPKLHNFIYKNIRAWTQACSEQNCLSPALSNLEKKVRSSHFVPALTHGISRKFFKELDISSELMNIFIEILHTTIGENGPATNPALVEMLANIREINHRLDKLLPTIVEPTLLQSVQIISHFAKSCSKNYENYKKFGKCDINELLQFSVRYRKDQEKRQTKMEDLPRRKPIRTAGDDITEEEFFARLDYMKNGGAPPPEMTQPQQNQQQEQQKEQQQNLQGPSLLDDLLRSHLPSQAPQQQQQSFGESLDKLLGF